MAETYTLKSPRPTRAQIAAVFKDVDMARKIDRLFDDLMKAAEAANANALEIDEIHEQQDTVSAIAARMAQIARQAQALAESHEVLIGMVGQLSARLRRLERAVSDLQEAPL